MYLPDLMSDLPWETQMSVQPQLPRVANRHGNSSFGGVISGAQHSPTETAPDALAFGRDDADRDTGMAGTHCL